MFWNYVIAAIIGIVIYQLIVALVAVVTNYDEDAILFAGALVPVVVVNFIATPIIRAIWLMWAKKHLNGYRAHYYRDSGKLDGFIQGFYATDKMAARLNQDESKKYFVKKVKDGKDLTEPPRFKEVYRGQKTVRGLDMTLFEKSSEK